MTAPLVPAIRETQGGLPSTEFAAIEAARGVADAMLDNETDADPLAIKNRAQAAIHLCDERNWPEAKREFAYAAICCEYRWTRENPREPVGRPLESTRKNNSDSESELNPRVARRLHETYDDATTDDLRDAKARADTSGETITRRHVRETVAPPPKEAARSRLVVEWMRGVAKVTELGFETVLADARTDDEVADCRAAFAALAEWVVAERERMSASRPAIPAPAPAPKPVTNASRTAARESRRGWPGPHTQTGPTWLAYADAYLDRYGVDPIWNGPHASKISQFVKRLGQLEAPQVAAFYVRHEDPWYRKQGHAVGPMLTAAEKLRMEWHTGRAIEGNTQYSGLEAARRAKEIRKELGESR